MTIALSPEAEAVVRETAEGSGFRSVEAYVNAVLIDRYGSDPIFCLSAVEVRAAIEIGLEQAERGELMSSEEARVEMAKWKAQWRAEHGV